METIAIRIESFKSEHQPWFEKFNRAWIEKYFWMEPIDVAVLQNPEQHILAHGGEILMAYADNEIVGTVALKKSAPTVFEFTKMAVDEKFRGKKIGLAIAEAAIEKAKLLGAHKIDLYSHTSLIAALHLYRKLGFVEVPVDGLYKRSDIKMVLQLRSGDKLARETNITIRRATEEDVTHLVAVGVTTFRESFDPHNTPANMRAYLSTNLTEEQFRNELLEDDTFFYVALDEKTIVGYAKIRKGEKQPDLHAVHAMELHRLYILKAYAGIGIGDQLMQTCLNHVRTLGYEWVWLGVWEHNLKAIGFYTKHGFEKFSDHVFTMGTDAQTDWLMKKKIV